MTYLQEPVKIFENFLRGKLPELTRVGLSNRQTTDSESFNGDDSETDFTLTIQPIAINTVTVDGSEVFPYWHFNIDLDNKIIKFKTAPGIGVDNVVVSFEKGSNWVFAGRPTEDLSRTKYPHITIQQLGTGSIFEELGTTNTENAFTMQFDILSYRKMPVTIETETKSGPDVTEYLARKLGDAIKGNFRYLDYRVQTFRFAGNNPAPFEPDKNVHRRIVQVNTIFRKNEEVIS